MGVFLILNYGVVVCFCFFEVVGFYLFKNLAKPAALTNLTERSLFFMIPTIRGIL